MRTGAAGSRDHGHGNWVRFSAVGLVVLLAGLFIISPESRSFFGEAYGVLSSGRQERIEAWVAGFGAWSYVVILALMLLQTLLPFLPSVVLMVVAVLSFGSVVGGLLAWGGLALAATLGYGIGRLFGVAAVDRLVGAKTERKVESFIDRYGIWAIVAARISPVLSTDAVSIAAGLAKMPFLPFFAATAAATLPLTILIAWLGEDVNRLKTGLIVISVVSLAAFVAYVIYDHRKKAEA